MKRTIILFSCLLSCFSLKAQDIIKVSLVQQDPRLQINMSYDRSTKLNRPGLPGDHLRYQVQKVYVTVTNKTADILNVNLTFFAERYCGQSDRLDLSHPNGGDDLKPGATITKSWSADRTSLGNSNCNPQSIGNGQFSYIQSVSYEINDIFNVSEERRKREQATAAATPKASNSSTTPNGKTADTKNTPAANTPAAANNPIPATGVPVYNPPAKDKFTRNVETATAIVNAVTPLIDQWAAQRQQKYEAEQLRVQAMEEQSAESRSRKLNVVMARKSLIESAANGKLPLSAQLTDKEKLYFFGFAYDAAAIVKDKGAISVSEIFTVQRYTDGSWPFAKTIKDKIAKTSKSSNPQFSGYYISLEDAQLSYNKFLDKCNTLGLSIIAFNYNEKNNTGTNNDSEFWGNEAKAAPQKAGTDTDFWDEPAPAQKTKSTVKKTPSKKH